MPRIKLAFWHGEHSPGDVISVSDEEAAALRRDGRIAEVLDDNDNDTAAASAPSEIPGPVPQQDNEAQPDPTVESSRKRR